MSQQWMSIIEYSRNFNVSDMTVRRRIKNGRLKASLRDGKYFIPVEANHQPESDDEGSGDMPDNLANLNQSLGSNAVHGFQNNHHGAKSSSTGIGSNKSVTTLSQGTHTPSLQARPSLDHPKSGLDGMPRGMPRPANYDNFIRQTIANDRSVALPGSLQPKKISGSAFQFQHERAEDLKDDQLIQVNSRDLLDFANKAIDQAEAKCRVLKSECELKLAAIETELSIRDKKIESLNQQIEDLQLLIKVIENKV